MCVRDLQIHRARTQPAGFQPTSRRVATHADPVFADVTEPHRRPNSYLGRPHTDLGLTARASALFRTALQLTEITERSTDPLIDISPTRR